MVQHLYTTITKAFASIIKYPACNLHSMTRTAQHFFCNLPTAYIPIAMFFKRQFYLTLCLNQLAHIFFFDVIHNTVFIRFSFFYLSTLANHTNILL